MTAKARSLSARWKGTVVSLISETSLFLSPSGPRGLAKLVTCLQMAPLWLRSRLPGVGGGFSSAGEAGNAHLKVKLFEKQLRGAAQRLV